MKDLKIKLSLESERMNIGVLEVETNTSSSSDTIAGVKGLIQQSNQLSMSTKIFWGIIFIAVTISIYFLKH